MGSRQLVTFLEQLGASGQRADRSRQDVLRAAEAAGLSEEQIAAIVSGDSARIARMLDAPPEIICFLVPAEDDEPGDDDAPDGDDQKDVRVA